MNLVETKILVAALFGIIRCTFGIIPIKLHRWLKSGNQQTIVNETRRARVEYVIALVQAFGGGVLFATCFLHMMPEVYDSVKELKTYGVLKSDYPYSQLVICLGFFTIYFAEELSNWFIAKTPRVPLKLLKQFSKVGPINKNIPNGMAFAITVKNDSDEDKDTKNEEDFDDTSSAKVICDNVDEEVQTENEKNLESLTNLENNLDLDPTVNEEIDEIIEDETKTQQQVLRCLLMIIALSFHALFEGLAIGLQQSITNIWYLFIAISIHSATILFCMGLEIVLAGTKFKTIFIHIAMLSCTSPLGVLLGLIISVTTNLQTSAKSIAIVVLLGLSSGTILYITFFETLSREKNRRTCRLARAISIGIGFSLMAILELIKTGP